jgi:hypothetical protein
MLVGVEANLWPDELIPNPELAGTRRGIAEIDEHCESRVASLTAASAFDQNGSTARKSQNVGW